MLILIVSFFYGAIISLEFESAVFACTAFVFILTVCSVMMLNVKKNNYSNLLVFTLGGYFILSYLFKAIVILDDFKFIKNLKSLNQQVVNLHFMDALVISFVFILGLFLLPFLIYHSSITNKYCFSESKENSVNIRFTFALYICLFMLIFKVFVHHFLHLGVPGVEAESVPVVGGIITYFVRMGGFALINILLFFSLKSNDGLKISISFVICCLFCLIDLSIGVKYSIVYQLYMFFILIYMTRDVNYRIKKNLNRAVLVIGFFFLFIYSYINYYRFALLNGKEGIDAVLTALGDEKAQSSNAMLEILNRIAGIENLLFSLVHRDSLNANVSNIFNSEFSVSFTESITGISGAVNAVGATQVGLMSIIFEGNYFLIFLASFLLSIFLLFVLFTILRIYGESLYLLSFSISAIFITYILFGTGNLSFYMKELFVMLVAVKMFLLICLNERHNLQ